MAEHHQGAWIVTVAWDDDDFSFNATAHEVGTDRKATANSVESGYDAARDALASVMPEPEPEPEVEPPDRIGELLAKFQPTRERIAATPPDCALANDDLVLGVRISSELQKIANWRVPPVDARIIELDEWLGAQGLPRMNLEDPANTSVPS